jgi:hypothetical protein
VAKKDGLDSSDSEYDFLWSSQFQTKRYYKEMSQLMGITPEVSPFDPFGEGFYLSASTISFVQINQSINFKLIDVGKDYNSKIGFLFEVINDKDTNEFNNKFQTLFTNEHTICHEKKPVTFIIIYPDSIPPSTNLILDDPSQIWQNIYIDFYTAPKLNLLHYKFGDYSNASCGDSYYVVNSEN